MRSTIAVCSSIFASGSGSGFKNSAELSISLSSASEAAGSTESKYAKLLVITYTRSLTARYSRHVSVSLGSPTSTT
jgi:hypothetical protein